MAIVLAAAFLLLSFGPSLFGVRRSSSVRFSSSLLLRLDFFCHGDSGVLVLSSFPFEENINLVPEKAQALDLIYPTS